MAEPMYRQIADDLRGKIDSGEIAHGAQLPTEIELMDEYSASRNTVRDAIKLLTIRGLVEPRPGQGTFVVEKINPFVTTLTSDPVKSQGGGEEDIYIAEVKAGGRTPTVSDPRVEVQRASEPIADALRIEEGDQVVSRHIQRFIDGIPFSLQTSFYPMSLVLQGATRLIEATDIPEGTVVYLHEMLGVKQVGYRDSIQVRPPDDLEAPFFRIPADGQIPVFEVYRIAFDQNHKRVRLTITVYPADRNRLVVSVGDVPLRASDMATSGDAATRTAEGTPSGQG
ncbi:MAG TPA: GntR family transcriptional regulator [Streptosporangiaceae bacterium]|jgi:GntR family transcriptional regulator